MHLCKPRAYEHVLTLCDGLAIHAAVPAILRRVVSGVVYVDDPARPRSALLHVGHRIFLAGAADNAAFNAAVCAWFDAEVYPAALAEGAVEWELYYDDAPWERAMQQVLAARHPMVSWREHYRLRALAPGWRDLLPEGMALRPVDRRLMAQSRLEHLDDLQEEMCSERPSVDAFLARSHGVCAIDGDAIVAWCLSEYDQGDRCEIGIETVPNYRRRGLATVTASALVEYQLGRGVSRIGWHCWQSNVASGATARRVGFAKDAEYAVLFAWFDEAANLAVNANVRLDQEPAEALAWFRRSLATGRAPAWAFFGAARAAAASGDVGAALGYLTQAVDRGFAHAAAIRGAGELRALHDSPEWRRLLARIEGGDAIEG